MVFPERVVFPEGVVPDRFSVSTEVSNCWNRCILHWISQHVISHHAKVYLKQVNIDISTGTKSTYQVDMMSEPRYTDICLVNFQLSCTAPVLHLFVK